jgi:cytosine/adenosine deaminase-related metal-dependent hydrolase
MSTAMPLLLEHGWICTFDDAGTEIRDGWILVRSGSVEVVGEGPPPDADERIDLRGAVVTPGLVNTHHHLYQTLTRARAQEATLFEWLRELYPFWSRLDAEAEYAAARTGLAELALSGCTTVFDHHYVFPRGREGLIEAEVQAARELGVRIVAARGSMDLGESDGGLPPDELVEEIDDVLADTERLFGLQDGDGMMQLAVAPCSPFSVTRELMAESAALARRLGLRLHTHLAETVEEDEYCSELYGCRPVEYLGQLGWVAADVWCAHCVHLSGDDVGAFGRDGVGVAHCPTSNLRLGAGVAPVRELLDAGAPVGLGVDGSASNERSDLLFEVKQALLVARGRGGPGGAAGAPVFRPGVAGFAGDASSPRAMTAREALRLGSRGGAAVLGRDDIGQLAPGKRADLAVWRTDGLELGGAEADPVAGLVLSAPHRVDRLYVGGEEVVRDGRLVRADEEQIAREHRSQARRFM